MDLEEKMMDLSCFPIKSHAGFRIRMAALNFFLDRLQENLTIESKNGIIRKESGRRWNAFPIPIMYKARIKQTVFSPSFWKSPVNLPFRTLSLSIAESNQQLKKGGHRQVAKKATCQKTAGAVYLFGDTFIISQNRQNDKTFFEQTDGH